MSTVAFIDLGYHATRARRNALVSIHHAGSDHPGGVLSTADILTYLWFRELCWQAADPETRDRFILSKGHACPALYAVALSGYINCFAGLKASSLLG